MTDYKSKYLAMKLKYLNTKYKLQGGANHYPQHVPAFKIYLSAYLKPIDTNYAYRVFSNIREKIDFKMKNSAVWGNDLTAPLHITLFDPLIYLNDYTSNIFINYGDLLFEKIKKIYIESFNGMTFSKYDWDIFGRGSWEVFVKKYNLDLDFNNIFRVKVLNIFQEILEDLLQTKLELKIEETEVEIYGKRSFMYKYYIIHNTHRINICQIPHIENYIPHVSIFYLSEINNVDVLEKLKLIENSNLNNEEKKEEKIQIILEGLDIENDNLDIVAHSGLNKLNINYNDRMFGMGFKSVDYNL